MLTDEEIQEIVRDTFAPLRCKTEIWDYGAKLRFKVLDASNKTVLEMPSIPLHEIRDRNQLDQVLEGAKQRRGLSQQ
ncbi:hypothetical protein AB4Z01_15180 [Inquilinus sp. YAF38]|uniref:hypothetical protein n=1 Tax=Inquilinus sp. YAF38 TaxID=3233084 RepID=UPI003F8D951A